MTRVATQPPRDDAAAATIAANLERVRDAIATACRTAGRSPSEVCLVGVTKYVPTTLAEALLRAGCTDLGEGRPQGLWEKAAALPAARWHLVGRLQRNKVRRTLPCLGLLHSLDSHRLLETIRTEAREAGRTCAALVEVNLDGDPGRGGVAPEEVGDLVAAAAGGEVRVRGLMGMASAPVAGTAPGGARRQFAALRELRDRLSADHPGIVELSMGMSGDFAEAILEGATIVRIGSALWEGVRTDGPA